MVRKVRLSIGIAVSLLLFSACSGENKPTETQLRDALSAELPDYVKVTDFGIEAMENTGNEVEPLYVARFNAQLQVTSPLYSRDGRERDPVFLQPTTEEGAEVEVFGKSSSGLYQGDWDHYLNMDGNPVRKLGQPLASFAGTKTIIRGSAEETAHFDALKATAAKFEATLAELPIDKMLTEYYNTAGPFAGQFVIHEVLASRSEKVNNDEFRVHAKYSYRRQSDSEPAGEDRRMFRFGQRDGDWQVIAVGGARSGRIE